MRLERSSPREPLPVSTPLLSPPKQVDGSGEGAIQEYLGQPQHVCRKQGAQNRITGQPNSCRTLLAVKFLHILPFCRIDFVYLVFVSITPIVHIWLQYGADSVSGTAFGEHFSGRLIQVPA